MNIIISITYLVFFITNITSFNNNFHKIFNTKNSIINSNENKTKTILFLKPPKKNILDGCDQRYETVEEYMIKKKELEDEIKSKRNQIKMEYINMLLSTNYSKEDRLKIIENNLKTIDYVYNITKGLDFFEEL
jgi:hypothetical protein